MSDAISEDMHLVMDGRQIADRYTRTTKGMTRADTLALAESFKIRDAQAAALAGRCLDLVAELRAARLVVAAAEKWRDHKCIPRDSNCSAGDHDDCGRNAKDDALIAAVDAMRGTR